MLISCNPNQDVTTTPVESLHRESQLPVQQSECQKDETIMPLDGTLSEPCLEAPAGVAKESVIKVRQLERTPDEDNEDEISSVTALLSGRRTPPPLQLSSQTSVFPLREHPLFPSLPVYKHPPSTLDTLRYLAIRFTSFILSLLFLLSIVVGALLRSIWLLLLKSAGYIRGENTRAQRLFHTEERVRRLARRTSSRKWQLRQEKREVDEEEPEDCPPLEGGKDPIVDDVAYYARRVGLDVETFKVQTEDGFILTLWHVYNPQEYTPLPPNEREPRGANVFSGRKDRPDSGSTPRKYPVLLMHGLLQNSGAFCANDDESLAFFLCKSGYDVWLGNNRCGLEPEHTTMVGSDPRMWTWTIQHMGVYDLTALISRVLYETGYEKLGLVCHSQGTAQTFVALAKEQRPELAERISVFCALAPAVYAGPLVECVYFKFMRVVSPAVFRIVFGIHSFIPLMLIVKRWLHPRVYGTLGYMVFSFLFNWTDSRWDRGLRDRMFQFAPVYVSTETIRWWLGAEGFSTHQCILAAKDACLAEVEEERCLQIRGNEPEMTRDDSAWYGPQTPPFALWVGGRDDLVDGRKLLQRLESGREPHVDVVHSKVIEDYEHLDVLWAIDMIEQVGKEVREVLWTTMPANARAISVVPRGVD
ncbi:Alpha/Beta hydrolase protein [Aspergillus egyptiacus]|nr:Alpha/Beta hydrolase protein [Aspergillus egyptiacus]